MPRSYLVVDRALTVTRQTRRLLERQNVDSTRVWEAYDAREAMELYLEHHPDVVIVGLDLPDMGGQELAKDIWEHDPGASLVVMTALPQDNPLVQDLAQEGAQAILRKPVRPGDIRQLVDELGRREPGRERIPTSG